MICGYYPTIEEQEVVTQTVNNLFIQYTEDDHESMLRKIHELSGYNTEYCRVGPVWQEIGFQGEDPVSDIRGGGILSLENLIYFLENEKEYAQHMMRVRSKRDERPNNQIGGYPWAACGINITRSLAVMFEMIQPSGAKNKIFSKKTYWKFLLSKNSFNRMFVLLFQLLDHIWEQSNATYLDFPRVLEEAKLEFEQLLSLSYSLHDLENRVYCSIHMHEYNYCMEDTFTSDDNNINICEINDEYINTTRTTHDSSENQSNVGDVDDNFICLDTSLITCSKLAFDDDSIDVNSNYSFAYPDNMLRQRHTFVALL